MEKIFKLKEHGTDVRTEVTAGLTTFFAMSYILFVNPAMLAQTGMPAQGVFLATIIGAVAGTLMMAFYANLPYAQGLMVWGLMPSSPTQWFFFGLHLARGLSNGLSMWCYFINHHGNEST